MCVCVFCVVPMCTTMWPTKSTYHCETSHIPLCSLALLESQLVKTRCPAPAVH